MDRGKRQKGRGGALLLGALLLLLSGCGSTDSPSRYCAVSRTVSCYGNPGETESICDETCALRPGTSSYDPKTDCVTEYGPSQSEGPSCDEAIHDLEVAAVTPQNTCAPSDNDLPCKACAKESCCSTLTSCEDDESCQALSYCLWPCEGDAACQDDCYGKSPNGVELIEAYFGCLDESCAEACR